MIAFYILLTVLVIGWLIMQFSHRHEKMGFAVFLFTIVLIVVWGLAAIVNVSNRDAATERYNTLVLYEEAVENSNNEAMRFDYYERVEDWNTSYSNAKNLAENPWLNWMLLTNMNLSEVDTIEFELKR